MVALKLLTRIIKKLLSKAKEPADCGQGRLRTDNFDCSICCLKADFHSPISGARATFSERLFAITWCCLLGLYFQGAKQTPRLLLEPK